MEEIVWAREGFRKLQMHLTGRVVMSCLQGHADSQAHFIKLSIDDDDVKAIRDLVKTLPQSRCIPNFKWPIIDNIAVFVSNRNTCTDFTPIYDYTSVEKFDNPPTLAATDVQVNAKVHVEYTAYMWKGNSPYLVSESESRAMTTTTYLKKLMRKFSYGKLKSEDIVWLSENEAKFLGLGDSEIDEIPGDNDDTGCILELTSLKVFTGAVLPLPATS
jgi:hypothetical protein